MDTQQPSAIPSLFVSHGAPLFAVDAGETGPALTHWAQQLAADQALRAVVVLSPHWMTRQLVVMTNDAPATWHDFGGFPPELYRINYPAPGDAALGQAMIALLQTAGLAAAADAARPLDHGAWVPLMHLLPRANVPVAQLSLPVGWGPREVYRLGAALAPLRKQGVLLMGSGSMTHNLSEFFGGERDPAPYVVEFSRWVEAALQAGRTDELFDYRAKAPHAARAHPTEDHFLPLFFAWGAAGEGAQAQYLSREVMYSMLAMDAIAMA